MEFGISKEKEDALKAKMASLGIKEADLEEKFIRSSGKGGQHVNKTSTCVYIKHKPTGIEVKCQNERSQTLNRFLARRILVKKIEALILGRESEERQRIEKIRRQKRKRSKRAKRRCSGIRKCIRRKKNYASLRLFNREEKDAERI